MAVDKEVVNAFADLITTDLEDRKIVSWYRSALTHSVSSVLNLILDFAKSNKSFILIKDLEDQPKKLNTEVHKIDSLIIKMSKKPTFYEIYSTFKDTDTKVFVGTQPVLKFPAIAIEKFDKVKSIKSFYQNAQPTENKLFTLPENTAKKFFDEALPNFEKWREQESFDWLESKAFKESTEELTKEVFEYLTGHQLQVSVSRPQEEKKNA